MHLLLEFRYVNDVEEGWNQWVEEHHLLEKISEQELKDAEALNLNKQVFISSHSPVLINEFINLTGDHAAIYEFERGYTDSTHRVPFTPEQITEITQQSITASVRKVADFPHSILDNLGAQGSDLLQTNGIVWVEGPSDVVYIKKWLEMYVTENGKAELVQGIDYEFQMFGGTLLDSLCLIKHDIQDEHEEYKKLVDMFSFSRNAFVATDSDAVYKDNGEIVDQSNFKNAKKFISEQIDQLNEQGYKLGMWYKESNTEIRTMENHLDKATLNSINVKSYSKKIYAQKASESWGDSKQLSDFKYGLGGEIGVLYRMIQSWNC